jgi:hypothetical protein
MSGGWKLAVIVTVLVGVASALVLKRSGGGICLISTA